MKWCSVVAISILCVACGKNSPPANGAVSLAPASDARSTSEGAAAGVAVDASGKDAATAAGKDAAVVQPTIHEVTLASGTPLRLDLVTAVGSDSSRVEEPVRATLRQAVVVKGQTVLPAGTELTGVVTDVERSGRVKGLARVAFRFTSLRHAGERYAIQTAPVAQQAAATKGNDAKKIAIGAGAGAALGAILGGGGGAAKGAAIGGAGGTGVVLATRGKEVRLGPGADITTRLTAPLTLRVRS
jgi:hypothetical protein